jgi:hypothetical protein
MLDAGGFADTDTAEDSQLAARLARRGPFICIDDAVRIYHRHPYATRITNTQPPTRTLRHIICTDCLNDPAPQLFSASSPRSYGNQASEDRSVQPAPDDISPSTPQVAGLAVRPTDRRPSSALHLGKRHAPTSRRASYTRRLWLIQHSLVTIISGIYCRTASSRCRHSNVGTRGNTNTSRST